MISAILPIISIISSNGGEPARQQGSMRYALPSGVQRISVENSPR
jgi:hypothetical protein